MTNKENRDSSKARQRESGERDGQRGDRVE
jgi:hypothetical protein